MRWTSELGILAVAFMAFTIGVLIVFLPVYHQVPAVMDGSHHGNTLHPKAATAAQDEHSGDTDVGAD